MSGDRPLMALSTMNSVKERGSHGALRSQPSTLFSGDTSAVAPPVPIPNTAVKRCSPDGSTAIGCARVGRRQNPATCFQVAGLFFNAHATSGEHRPLACWRRLPAVAHFDFWQLSFGE